MCKIWNFSSKAQRSRLELRNATCFGQNVAKCLGNLIIFGTQITNTIKLCEIHSFMSTQNTLPEQCQVSMCLPWCGCRHRLQSGHDEKQSPVETSTENEAQKEMGQGKIEVPQHFARFCWESKRRSGRTRSEVNRRKVGKVEVSYNNSLML